MNALAVGVTSATALAQLDRIELGQVGWLFDLLVHLPKQLALLAFIVAAAASVLRMWKAAGLSVAATAVNLVLVLGVTNFSLPRSAAPDAPVIRVVSANVHNSREALIRLAELARNYRADLVAVNEAPDISEQDIAALFPDLPLQRKAANAPDGAALTEQMLFASRATNVGEVAIVPYSGRAILRFVLVTGDRPIRVVITHPEAPGSPGDMAKRDILLAHIGDGLDETQPFVVLGDLNTTPWSRAFGRVPGQRAGDPRFEGTFPSFAGPLGIPIDHLMFGGGLVLTDFRIGPDIGSDHLPLLAAFATPDD